VPSRSFIVGQKVQPKTQVNLSEKEKYGTFKAKDIIIEER